MKKKFYTLENIQELELECKEITVEDHTTGETKVVKTVNRADIVCVVAYMLGVQENILDEYYSHHHGALLKQLRTNRAATIIRYISKIRTTLLNNFHNVDTELCNNIKNLNMISCFDANEIDQLIKWGVCVMQSNYRADKYVLHLSKIIDAHIDECKELFPEAIKYNYIRNLFVPPKYNDKGVRIDEYNKFMVKKNLYPFQMYMYWEPVESGNILYNDPKFLSIIYSQHNEVFYEWNKYKDASDETKKCIYDFIRESEQIVMVVDCENVDPYKLYGVLRNLDTTELKLINKIILYDDYHTTIAWDYIEKLIDIPVEHIEVNRVMTSKSLVDMSMAVGVTTAHYGDGVDSFILCSSDSDFWGLISSIPEARFLVMYEYSKCGAAIKEALSSYGIFHCATDDFYMANAGDLQKIVLKKILEHYLPNIVGEDSWELTRKIFSDAFIQASDNEMKHFYEKYIKHLRLKLDNSGKFYIAVED